MTVYVVQQPKPNKSGFLPDFSSAADFGEMKFIFSSDEKVFAIPGPSLTKAKRELKVFNQEEDYILWHNAGDPAAMYAVLIALMAEHNPSKINFLYWNRKRDSSGNREPHAGFYVPCKFENIRMR